MLTYESFIPALVVEVPGFRAIYEAHLDAYDEVLPHVLLGDLTRYVIDTYRQSRIDASGIAQQTMHEVLAFLEHAMQSSDPRLLELISVSFLENLSQAADDYGEIKVLLGSHLAKELTSYEAESL
jgi:hypothetical protein